MRRIIILTAALLCAANVLAQDAKHDGIPLSSGQGLVPHKSKPEAPKPPIIPDEIQKAFFKAQSEFFQAQAQAILAKNTADQAQAVYNAEIKKTQDLCGPLWQAQLDKDKFPICAAKAPEAKPAEKK